MNPDTTNTAYVVTTDWLADHLDDPKVRVLDVTGMLTSKLINRAKSEVFDASHIPGSLFFDVAAGKGVLSDQLRNGVVGDVDISILKLSVSLLSTIFKGYVIAINHDGIAKPTLLRALFMRDNFHRI